MPVPESKMDFFKWIMSGLMSLMVAATIAGAGKLFELSVAVAQIQTRMEAQTLAITQIGVDRYTSRDAEADARRQAVIDGQLAKELERIEARMTEWNGRLSGRITALETAMRQRDAAQ